MKNGRTANVGSAVVKVRTLESAVRRLTPSDLQSFRKWFADFDAKAWDRQLEADAKCGRLDDIADRALADHKRGKSRDL